MRDVKVVVWGFGAMGRGVAHTLLQKSGVRVTGVCDLDPAKVGRDIYDLLEMDAGGRPPVLVCDDITQLLRPGATGACAADVCVIATDSFVEKVFPKVMLAVQRGINVVTTAEEMSYPKAQHPQLAARMDAAAKAQGVSVLGTGINPGFVMDLLAICLSGAMTEVSNVTCRRINSLSPFGPAVMAEQGVGLSVAEFERKTQDGTLAGHVGFAESVAMISDALGLGVDAFEQEMAPIVTKTDRRALHGAAAAGSVAGVEMRGRGLRGGEVLVEMEHPQQIEPEAAGVDTADIIELSGTPPILMTISPEIEGGLGTVAMTVNCIPHAINAAPGLITMLDIPVPRAVMGDFRDAIHPGKLAGE